MAIQLRSIVGRITELLTTQTNAISRQLRISSFAWARRARSMFQAPTKDWARADYQYFRNLAYGRVRGAELSGVFVAPIVNKVSSWTLGTGLDWKLENAAAQEALTTWWTLNHPQIMRAMRSSLKLGDAWLVINSDLSLTLLPPDTVDPIVDPNDYGLIIGWRVTQVLAHPETTQRMTLVDEYYPDRRVQSTSVDGRQSSVVTYPNLLGRLQIVHIPNQKDEGDTFGHPEVEALVELLLRYNTVLEAAIDGNERQGRPTPVLSFETVADLDRFWDTYGVRETRTLPTGESEAVYTLGVDLTQILTVSGATFEYASPGSFTQDTAKLLELLFYLLLEHSEIPEFVFGNAIASSMASASTQMPVFERMIDGRRQDATGWLVDVAGIVLGYLSLTTPGVAVEAPTIQWNKLTTDGTLTLQTIQWALAEGLLDEKTALMLAPIEISEIDQVLDKAREEKAERMAEQQALMPDPTDPTDPAFDDEGEN